MRKIAKILLVSLVISVLSISANAYARVDTQKPISFSLTYEYEKNPISGINISLYKVYDMNDSVRFTPTESFKKAYGSEESAEFHFNIYDDYWKQKDQQGNIIENKVNWSLISSTLESLLLRDINANRADMPKPVNKLATDDKGMVSFNELKAGLYLVMGETKVNGRYTYKPQTFLLALPSLNQDDTWNYTLNAKGKMSTDYDPPSGGGGGGGSSTVSVTVNKVWDDADSEDVQRPSSVSVQLMRDGQNYSTITLNEANNWKHTWNLLSSSYNWTVAENNVPDGYTVSIDGMNRSFTITNTADSDIDDPDVPLDGGEDTDNPDNPDVDIDDPDVPQIDIPNIDEIPDENVPKDSGDGTTNSDDNGEKLPQTGVLWWPVQALTFIGVLLFAIGWFDMKHGRNKG